MIRFDLGVRQFWDLYSWLQSQQLLSYIGGVVRHMEFVHPPNLENHPTLDAEGQSTAELDLVRALRGLGFLRPLDILNSTSQRAHTDAATWLKSMHFCLDSASKNGLIRHLDRGKGVSELMRKSIVAFRLHKGALSQSELDDLVQRYADIQREKDDARANRRRKVLGLFTSNQCFNAATAKALGSAITPDWKCGKCQYCVTGKPAMLPPFDTWERVVEKWRLDRVIQAVPERYRDDPRFLARLGLGAMSRRAQALGLQFEITQDSSSRATFLPPLRLSRFEDLIKAFANRAGIPQEERHEL
ncbi:unnamed protein product [Discula destructiva]